MTGVLVLLLGCSEPKPATRAVPGTQTGPMSGAPDPSVGVPVGPGTDTGTQGDLQPAPGCYTVYKPVGAPINTWSIATMPATDGVPSSVLGINGELQGFITNLAWFDDTWWICMNRVIGVRPQSGAMNETGVPCSAMVVHDGMLTVRGATGPWNRFASAADVVSGAPATTVYESWPHEILPLASDGTTLFGAGSAPEFVYRIDTLTNAQEEVAVPTFSGRCNGMSVLGPVLRMIESDAADPQQVTWLVDIDPTTGSELGRTSVGGFQTDSIYGLWCAPP